MRARPRIALGAIRATRRPQYAEDRPHDRRFPAPFHAARIDQGGPGRPPDPQLRRLGRAELYDPFAALRSRRARADDGFGRHRRRLADQRRRHVRRSRHLAPRQRQGETGRARLSRPLHRRRPRPPARRRRRVQGTGALPPRAWIPGRHHHVGIRRQMDRRSGDRAVLGRSGQARPVRVRAPGAQTQSRRAVRRLRHRARRRPRVLADHGDHPPGQFRRVRPPSRADRAHGASLRRHRLHARAHQKLSRQGRFGEPPATHAMA